MYTLVRNQLRLSAMGDVISLDYAAVLDVLNLYFDNPKAVFEDIIILYNKEKEVAETLSQEEKE